VAVDARTRLEALDPAALLGRGDLALVDLRSPSEFAEDHLPGAVNVPLFDDAERTLVGTLYRQVSGQSAFETGVQLTRAKLRGLVAEVLAAAGRRAREQDLDELLAELTAGGLGGLSSRLDPQPAQGPAAGALVLCCWRGGLRSQSVAALLTVLGHRDVYLVAGGYKAWRALVRERLARCELPQSFVLRGLTGVGKTLVLRELELLRPGWTLDLEGLAGHRSSILGRVGLEPVGQRTFESRLLLRLLRGFDGPLVLEGESRKVGDVVLPEPIYRAVDRGLAIELVASRERRVAVLLDEYLAQPSNRAQIAAVLPYLEQRIGARKYAGVLTALLEQGRETELVELLLDLHYDPLYRHSERGRSYLASIRSDEPEAAAAQVAAFVETELAAGRRRAGRN
jgi:tRNA 2-selenouridine synthase